MTFQHLCGIASPMLVAGALALADGCALAVETPYAGQQHRAIKALSDQDVAALLAGQGFGFAKAAELNGYPGPAHVLELRTALHLSESQLRATEELMRLHRARARDLGAALVDAESQLDRLFQHRQATPDSVDRAMQKIALLQARLRAEHLKTHLAQAALLDSEQTRLYGTLRGYGGGADRGKDVSTPAHEHHGSHGSRP